ncbi:AAA family ATPase [Baekduia soli]|uniref:endopeptidase La n=1 Tax=Baekduia soli TaxID=496014 RepID=A0A5B8U492_9ACTN|nr:ATP-binding protein [Baekduia soli]QEC47929.1 AAA family ATPase [Baekduia soli]
MPSPALSRRPPGAPADQLRRICPPAEVPVGSTADLEAGTGSYGQPRAAEALAVAAAMPADGYNVFATGPADTGMRAMVGDWLREHARTLPAPPDLVHVADFADPLRPLAITVPTGRARALAAEADRLVQDGREALARAFDSDSFRTRHRRLHEEADHRRAEILGALEARAREAGVALQLTPAGVLSVPLVAGRPLQPDEVASMPDEVRRRFEAAVADLGAPVDQAFGKVRDIERDLGERHRELNHDVAEFAIGHLVQDARARWAGAPRVADWLQALRDDMIEHLDAFRAGDDAGGPAPVPGMPPGLRSPAHAVLARYAVNVLVANDPAGAAPVIVATDPSFYDLFGRVEYETAFGAAVTDHRHLRAGLVHQASGAFLVLQAADVLSTPYAWARLKDVLRTGRLKIENVAVQYMLFPGVTLDPEPAEIHVTVILVGPVELYELLLAADDDLGRLFKLRADFDDEMPRDAAGVQAYAGWLARLAGEAGLPAFDRGAIAAMVEEGSRLAGHRDRLSTRTRLLRDIATEAAHIAVAAGAPVVGGEQIAAALAARRRRSDLVEERMRVAVLEGTHHIDLDGTAIGQINGLAVSMVGDHAFGHPVRITSTVAPGEGEVLDIDREARLSGPIHAKGILILSGFLAGRYFRERPMALRASIVFEQSYGPVEGDSASTAELLALLSAIGGLPVLQGIAVTGAVDQHGAVHAVGGINEKIEGYFDLCDARGLTGEQGVVVPAANLPHLMLAPRVVDAVAAGRFCVWPVTTVDQAMELVTGRTDADAAVRDRLLALARAAMATRPPAGNGRPRADGGAA